MKNCGFEFTAKFPDDAIEEGEGEDWRVVRPGGMALTYALAELVRRAGLSADEPEADLDHESWVFTAEKDGKRYRTQIYDFDDDQFLFVWGSSPWFKRWIKRRDFYFEYLQLLHRVMCSDRRFGSVRWVDLNRRPISPE